MRWCLILVVAISIGAIANEFEFTSNLNRFKIHQDESVVLTLTVKGVREDIYKTIQPPDLSRDFNIQSTRQSSSFSFINGTTERTRQYQYILQPRASGIYIIDPFRVVYQSKSYATKPLRIVVRDARTVLPASPSSPNIKPAVSPESSSTSSITNQRSVFLDTSVSSPTIFMGEHINYSVVLYRRISLWSSIAIQQDDLVGVWQTNMNLAPEKMVQKNGSRYYALELVKKTIRPLNEGVLIIPPVTARFVVDPFSGERQLTSAMVTINVMPLPDPKPVSFMGAIGSFLMTMSTPNAVPDSNTFDVQISIEGDGDLATIQPPVIQDTSEYRVLSAPSVPIKNGDKKRTFDYVIIPKVSGEIRIAPVEFSYFSKTDMQYVTQISPSFNIIGVVASVASEHDTLNVHQDIQFLVDNTVLTRIIAGIDHPLVIPCLLAMNGVIFLGFIVGIIRRRRTFRRDHPAKIRRVLLRRIEGMDQTTPVSELMSCLIQVLTFFTNYSEPSIDSKKIEIALYGAKVSEAQIKSTLQWIKNAQALQFSKDKKKDQHHSVSDSLKRILYGIIQEVGAS
ncbi:MAG: BatD family protein [Candidatus Marinamargulisbacteria bacterium]